MNATRPFYWSVRRELWEHRSIYIAPLAAAGVVLFGLLVGARHLAAGMRSAPALDAAKQVNVLAMPYSMAASVILLLSFIVGAFYCLDSLNAERRDRSILFWKSMPVSDLTTVLAKAIIPLAVLPLVAFVIALSTQAVMLLLNTAILLANGLDAALLWTRLPMFEMTLVMFYGIAVHALWYAPIYGWLLLVSAWARRTPFLWAVLPPLAIIAVEMIAFNKSFFAYVLKYRALGAMMEGFTGIEKGPITRLSQLDPVRLLSSPGLWVGLVFAAACVFAAVRLRRNREPI